MQVTMILEFPASYCHLARGIMQVYLLYFFFFFFQSTVANLHIDHLTVTKREKKKL